MNGFTLSSALHVLNFLSDSIFSGTKFLIPAIFIAGLLNINLLQQKLKLLTKAANVLLLTGGMMFLISFLASTGRMWFSGNDDERTFILGLATGSHWFQFIIPVFNFALLPNFMWIKRLRNTIYFSLVMVGWWFISKGVVTYLTNRLQKGITDHISEADIPSSEYLIKAVVFAILFGVVFIIIGKFNIRKQIIQEESKPGQ